ncbi:uncharacterized protein LOC123311113 isoform X2 [Coccinella septempunctata]|uniref:uncharacterized protein LOC123311113 isoform X2 n=1 Tax=Coccinella septempunctata TaxID=41139 RepID=UPI001D07682F|nr:uncharacterized protein LOC123311113 isoform X2 [Coccinella septempunctata]
MPVKYEIGKMHGAKRVLAFCCLTAILPAIFIIIPLYLRHSIFADVIYAVAESDIVDVVEGISSVFCQAHYLQMNTSFNAFQLKGNPQISDKMKHIRLKKSMSLPDDTFEYWGFFLLRGAVVKLKVCSRYDGSRMLVVKGDKHLKTCGILDKRSKVDAKMNDEHLKVKVTFEKPAVEIGVIDEDALKTNTAMEEMDEDNVDDYIQDRLNRGRSRLNKLSNSTESNRNQTTDVKQNKTKNLNHIDIIDKPELNRTRREKNFDAHIEHGGNAPNKTKSEESSVSSFETELLTCYNGQILLAQEFPSFHLCTDVHNLENSSSHMQTFHEVGSDGYYYYIFYSDNDNYNNDIHAVFDIFKPTYRFSNSSTEKSCINVTECTFSMSFWSDEVVVVEVPTRDGIEHEADDITYLLSRCQPRMTVYMIFPILVLFLILGCAFI